MQQSEAHRAVLGLAQQLGVIPGKKALQKLVYFLQEAEQVPLGLNFEMYNYGPYAPELEWLTRDLEAARLLRIRQVDEAFQISPAQDGPRYQEEAIGKVLEALGSRPRDLELLASLHYLANLRPYAGSPADKSSLKERLGMWKGRKFPSFEVDAAIRKLESVGYLRSP